MIYLKDRGLLFLKPFKTAGTSVEIALSCNANDDDIVAPFGDFLEDEFKRIELGGHTPCNWAKTRTIDAAYARRLKILKSLNDRGRLEDGEAVLYQDEEARYLSHMGPSQIIALDGREFFDRSFYVTMARHPYDQVISLAHWRNKLRNEFNLPYAIDRILNEETVQTNARYYFLDGEYLPDFVVRYEHLEQDLGELERRFDLRLTEYLPVTKKAVRSDTREPGEILSDSQKEQCVALLGPVFEALNYTP